MYSRKKECVAMLLAGGQGSRLYVLTQKVAKPAVPFGGKYRIIDFPLSNCTNSGIDTVGVLTQYQPLVLNDYIGNGLPWDLDRTYGGVKILPPYQGKHSADWYKGTANAIYQNLQFIDKYDADYVLVLSGDHIYKMDYSKMLSYHKKMGADCTIAVIDVPIEEANRFGILTLYDDNKIKKFTEKPKHPDSSKASMGIYIFTKDKLVGYLEKDAKNSLSQNDFGKNIIPDMLKSGEKMYAYPYRGYWKDVGTIESLWEANMDLLGEKPVFSLNDDMRRVYSRHSVYGPQYLGKGAKIKNSIISEGCKIYGKVENSVLFGGVTVCPDAFVKDSVIMNDTVILKGARVDYSLIDSNVEIGENSVIGDEKGNPLGICVVGDGEKIANGKKIAPGSMIPDTF